jgi:hypothetical protein
LLWAIVREKGGTIASHIEKAIVLYAKQLETEETQVTNAKQLETEPNSCQWTLDYLVCEDDETWQTACGQQFVINSGTPEENKMRYCCFCGEPLEHIIVSEPRDEEEQMGGDHHLTATTCFNCKYLESSPGVDFFDRVGDVNYYCNNENVVEVPEGLDQDLMEIYPDQCKRFERKLTANEPGDNH